jgi:hypothetical protein
MQAVLDDYPRESNAKRLHQGRAMNWLTPIRASTKGMQKPINTEVTSQKKNC